MHCMCKCDRTVRELIHKNHMIKLEWSNHILGIDTMQLSPFSPQFFVVNLSRLYRPTASAGTLGA